MTAAASPATTQLETLRHLVSTATQRLLGDTILVTDEQWRAPSRLPDWTRGHVISDFIGTDGRDLFARVTNRLTPNLMLGLQIERAIIGSTVYNFTGPQENRFGGGVDTQAAQTTIDPAIAQRNRLILIPPYVRSSNVASVARATRSPTTCTPMPGPVGGEAPLPPRLDRLLAGPGHQPPLPDVAAPDCSAG